MSAFFLNVFNDKSIINERSIEQVEKVFKKIKRAWIRIKISI